MERQRVRWGIVRILWLGVAGALVVGCSSLGIGGTTPNANPNPGARPGTTVSVAKAVEGPITQVVAYSGTVQPADSVNLVPKISGRITKLNVDVGSKVKAGDVIAELDKASLEAQVAQAQAGVDAAKVKLEQIKAGARPEAVAAAEATARAAKAHADALQAGARPEAVAVAKANLDAARAKLAAMQAGPRPETVAQAKANLDAAQAKLQQLKDGPTPDQVRAAELAVDQAKNALASAQANKDGQCNPKNPAYQCEAAQASAFAAETAVEVAKQNLKTLTAPPTQDALNQAQAAVDAALQAYKLAQQPYTAQDLAQLQAAVDAAEQQYQLTQQPYTTQDLAQAQAQAEAAAEQAKLAAAPYTDLDQKAAEAAVEQAEAALALAKSQLDEAQVVAPFDGIISAKLLSPGALASTTTPIVTLLSPRLQVQFAVEEARIGSIKTDQTVNLTTSAFPDRTFPARVASIYPSADTKTHTFTVVVEPQNDDGSLKAGMFVELRVILAAKAKTVLAPRAALVQRGTQQIIFTVADGTAHLHPVTLGLSDDNNVEVLQGIKAGDDVVIAGQGSLADNDPVRVAGATGAAGSGGGTTGGAGSQRQGNRPANVTPSTTPLPSQ